jgi:hypothetical protein
LTHEKYESIIASVGFPLSLFHWCSATIAHKYFLLLWA